MIVHLLTLAGWTAYHAQCVAPLFLFLIVGAVLVGVFGL